MSACTTFKIRVHNFPKKKLEFINLLFSLDLKENCPITRFILIILMKYLFVNSSSNQE